MASQLNGPAHQRLLTHFKKNHHEADYCLFPYTHLPTRDGAHGGAARTIHNDWIEKPDVAFLHPRCTWEMAEGHPHQGIYRGNHFYDWYCNQLTGDYRAWNEVVKEIIGSSVGAIVVGEYCFQHQANGFWHSAPFTHFYRIQQGQITRARYFMGDASPCRHQFRPLTDRAALAHFCTLN